MAIPIVMPRLGDFMTEGILTRFTKNPGEKIKQGEIIAEIETEKVNYDLESTDSGIFHPAVEAGETVMVDAVMCYLLDEGEDPPAAVEVAETVQEKRPSISPGNRRQPTSKSGTIPSTICAGFHSASPLRHVHLAEEQTPPKGTRKIRKAVRQSRSGKFSSNT